MTSLFGNASTGAAFGGNATGLASAASTSNDPKDIEVSDPPSDSISSMSFSTAGEYLAVGSWNNEVRSILFNSRASWLLPFVLEGVLFAYLIFFSPSQVRIYEVNPQNGQTQGKAMYTHQGPVLDVCWNKVSCSSFPFFTFTTKFLVYTYNQIVFYSVSWFGSGIRIERITDIFIFYS